MNNSLKSSGFGERLAVSETKVDLIFQNIGKTEQKLEKIEKNISDIFRFLNRIEASCEKVVQKQNIENEVRTEEIEKLKKENKEMKSEMIGKKEIKFFKNLIIGTFVPLIASLCWFFWNFGAQIQEVKGFVDSKNPRLQIQKLNE